MPLTYPIIYIRYPWDSSKEPENPMQGPNLWPSKGEGLGQGWQQTLIDFYFEMVSSMERLHSGRWRAKTDDLLIE